METKFVTERDIQEETNKTLTERDIQSVLINLGTPTNLLGFTYLTKALMLVHKNPEYKHQITKKLYPEVAEMTNTLPHRAERAIRHAIEATWARGDSELLTRMFGKARPSHKDKPTNAEFITTLVLRLEHELEVSV